MEIPRTKGYTCFVKIAESALEGDRVKARRYIKKFIIMYPESDLVFPFQHLLNGVKNPDGLIFDDKIGTNAIQTESFRVDDFNQKRLMKDLNDDVETIRKQFEKPSDYDIENAANEYAEENQHQRRSSYGKLHKAYTEGAKDMRDGRIYVSPKSSKDYFKPDEDGAM